MIKQSNKIKRGTLFVVIETGEECKHDIITHDGLHMVIFPNGTWQTFQPDELMPTKKQRTPISNKPKKLTEAKQSDKEALNLFFDTLVIPARCQECGDMLMAFNKFAKRSVCCHILPKFKFESIAINPLNIIFMGADFLGGCSDHDFFDASLSNRKKMNVYPLVLERYELLKPLLTDAEIISANKYLGV